MLVEISFHSRSLSPTKSKFIRKQVDESGICLGIINTGRKYDESPERFSHCVLNLSQPTNRFHFFPFSLSPTNPISSYSFPSAQNLLLIGILVTHAFSIEIHCTHCGTLVLVPYRPTAKLPWIVRCSGCNKQFGIDSSTIARQIKLFVGLCQQLKAAEEILANAAIAVTVGSTEVKIPFRLLLTRLKSTLDLDIDGKKISVSSRTDPLKIGEAAAREETVESPL